MRSSVERSRLRSIDRCDTSVERSRSIDRSIDAIHRSSGLDRSIDRSMRYIGRAVSIDRSIDRCDTSVERSRLDRSIDAIHIDRCEHIDRNSTPIPIRSRPDPGPTPGPRVVILRGRRLRASSRGRRRARGVDEESLDDRSTIERGEGEVERERGSEAKMSDSESDYSDDDAHIGGGDLDETYVPGEASLNVDVGSSLTSADWADIDNSDLVAKVRGSAGFRIMRERFSLGTERWTRRRT